MKLYLSLLAFISLFSFSIPPSCCLTPDGDALLELKNGFNDTKGFLRSWKHKDHNPCGWLGVTCHFPDLRVRSMFTTFLFSLSFPFCVPSSCLFLYSFSIYGLHCSNLPYMQLSGFISPSIGKLQRLHRLALHRNSLHGPIPPEIKNCSELRAIYLRANYLHGSIPAELGELVHLTILDLSSNLLRGTIPPSIGRLVNLRFLNLSTNFFSGEIPNVGVLNTFRNTSFVGNLELCGLPIQKLCRGSLGFPAVLPHSDNVASQGTTHFRASSLNRFIRKINKDKFIVVA
ncbi:putative non-specific serine/threonine protein kinase [Dioscorea sansibarensis]